MDDQPSHVRMPPGNWAKIARSPCLYRLEEAAGSRHPTKSPGLLQPELECFLDEPPEPITQRAVKEVHTGRAAHPGA